MDVQIRIGLNSGEVVVRAIGSDLHMDYTAVGQTTHLAARMEQLAQPGTTALTAATVKLVEGLVDVEALGAATVKGLARPVDIYSLVAMRPARSRLSIKAARGLSRFVGRGDELQHLDRARERMVFGEGQVVAVSGEPGIGKSRLFWEFTRLYCHSHHLVLEAGSVSHGKATPFLPLTDLLSAYFSIERRDDARHVQERIKERLRVLDETLVSLHTPLRSLFPGFVAEADWLALDARERRRRTLDACRRLLLRESQVQPLVIVFEDLHWIDSETQAFLDHLVEDLATAPILLLVNYRPEYECAWTRKGHCSELLLEPLAPPPAAELLDSLLGHDEGLLALKRLVIERTEGNPFFLEETVRALVETGRLAGATADASRLELAVPATVHAVLGARIDRLPPDEKQLLQAASAIGKEVSFALLQAIADRSNDELQRGLARLQAAGFIYEARSLPELEFSFKHALTHEVTYRSLLRSTKQRYHERIARSLISRFSTIAETRPELVAHHLSETEAAAEALIWWERASKRATDRSANLDALGYCQRALALLENHPQMAADHSHELRIRVAMYGPLSATTGYASDAMEELVARVGTIATHGTDRELVRRAMWAQFGFFVSRGPLATGLHFAEQLREMMPPDAPDWWVVSNEAALVDIYCNMGEYRLAVEAAQRGFPLYDMDRHNPKVVESDQDRGVALLSMHAISLGMLGYNDQAELLTERAVELARRVAHPYTVACALFVRLLYFGLVGRTVGYGETVEEMHAIAVRYGFVLAFARVTAAKGWGLVLEGRPDEGIPFIRDGVASIQAIGGRIGVTPNLQRLADGCIRAGRLSEARDALDGAFANMREYGDHGIESRLQRAKGDLILAESIDKAAAEACYLLAIDKARRTEARLYELQASTRLAQLWHTRGKTQEARALLSGIYGWFTEGFDSLDLVNARATLAAMR